jgi:hypothetical protein
MNQKLGNYQYKGSLKNIHFENNLVESVATSIINDFPDIAIIKNNVEVINLICNIVEEVSSTRNSKQNKEELFFKIYERIFRDVGNADKVFVSNIIQFLLSNNLIEKVSMIRKLINKIKNIFSRKN